MLTDSAPQLKLSLYMLTGVVITTAALGLCWLTGSDPCGGFCSARDSPVNKAHLT